MIQIAPQMRILLAVEPVQDNLFLPHLLGAHDQATTSGGGR